MTDYELGMKIFDLLGTSDYVPAAELGRACREACAVPGEMTAAEMREACAREAMSSKTHDYNAGIAAAIRAIPLTKEAAK